MSAVTPTGKPSPRRIGGQLAARLSQSTARTPQTNQSARSTAKPTPSPVKLTQLTPKPALNQSTPRSTLSSQSAPRLVQTNKSTSSIATTKVLANPNFAIINTKDIGQPLQVVRPEQVQKLNSPSVTFKMVKAPNGATYLVQQKKVQRFGPKPPTTPVSTLTTVIVFESDSDLNR